jgi:hypothetical protein
MTRKKLKGGDKFEIRISKAKSILLDYPVRNSGLNPGWAMT